MDHLSTVGPMSPFTLILNAQPLLCVACSVIGQFEASTAMDWVAILELSTRWQFDDIRELAIRRLSSFSLDPVRKIALHHRYAIDGRWALDAYVTLCSRSTPLTVTEARQLGVDTTALVGVAREKMERWWRRDNIPEVTKVVRDVFGLEEEPPVFNGPVSQAE